MGASHPARSSLQVTQLHSPEVIPVSGVSKHEDGTGWSRLPPDDMPEPSQPLGQQQQRQQTNHFGALGFLRGISGSGAAVTSEYFSPASQGSWPSSAKAEIERLEEALVLEVRRCVAKEDELEQMRRVLLKLEDLVQKQDETRQDEDRLSSIELVLRQQQTDTEEKVAKLLLAVAGEKRRAESAERSREEAQQANKAKLKQLQALLEMEHVACQRLQSRVDELEECLKLPRDVEQCSPRLPACPDEVDNDGGDACTAIPGVQAESAAVKKLQQQLRAEQELNLQLQTRLLEKDVQLRIPWRRDDSTNSSESTHEDIRQPSQELQHQLADEIALRRDAESRVAELDRQLRKLERSTETKDVSQQHALQNRLIEKDREVCELQDQLVRELAKQQQMGYTIIEKDETVFDLQQRLQRLRPKTKSFTTPALSQPPVRGEGEADAGCSLRIQAAPKSKKNTSNMQGNGFGSPMPLGWRPSLASGRQMSWMPASDSFGVVSPWPAAKLQGASGGIRRGMYMQHQQQQVQGSSIMDGCSTAARAATFCCSPRELQGASGSIRRGMYVHQQQQQVQGSSTVDGCSTATRAASLCCSPRISYRELSRSFHGC